MKKELVGMTLAVSIGLNACAFAAAPAPISGAFQVRYPALKSRQGLNFLAPSENPDLQALAMAEPQGLDDRFSGDHLLLALAKSAARPAATSSALNQGIANYNRGYVEKAIPFFEQAAQQNAQSEAPFIWLARSYQKQGKPADLTKAKAAYQKVLTLNPNNVEALSNLGEMWSWDPALRAEAVNLLKRGHELNPKDAGIAKKLSEALFWQGNAMDALRYAAPIANQYQNDKKFMAEYAQMLSVTGHADEALKIYSTILQGEGTPSIGLKVNQARAFHGSGQTQKAQALYEEIGRTVANTPLSKEPDFIQSMSSLAFDLGLFAESFKWDQTLPASTSRQKDVQLRQARALTKVYRVPEAIDRFHRLYEAGLLTTDEKLEYAEYIRMLHLAPDALPAPNLLETLYAEAAQESPNNPEVALRMARLYSEEANRFDDTVSAYQKALGNPALQNRATVQKEFLDYLKTDKTQPVVVENLFKQMLSESPDDLQVKTAYAEYLSWQTDRRSEALRMYVELGQADTLNAEAWESRIEEVLKWHKPTTAMIPVYQEVVNLYPQNKAIWLAVARAYASDKNYYTESIETYSKLVKNHPDDGTIKREWLGLLLSNERHRSDNVRLLKTMTTENPGDLDVLAAYGKLLSYEHQYGRANDAFEQVLSQNPEHREALVGKGYVILWSGRKLAAKDFFQDLRAKYPDDVDVALGLAQTEKLLGRYDQAMKIIQEIKPLMDQADQADQGVPSNPQSSALPLQNDAFLPVAYQAGEINAWQDNSVQDYSIVPVQTPVQIAEASPDDLNALRSEIDALSDAVNTLKLLQESSRNQLDHLDKTIRTTRDAVPYEMSLQAPDESDTQLAKFAGGNATDETGLTATSSGGTRAVGQAGMSKAYGNYTALDYDTNPLLSGLGRFRNDDLDDLEKGLANDLRPMIRSGFQYSRQGGDDTTTRLSSWGFPSQVSLSLTPQVRVRAAFRPGRFFLPNGVSPDSTNAFEYGVGGTIKYWDRLTLDGDMAFTRFSQSESTNVTFQAQAQYDFNDSIRAKVGMSRLPQYTSLLTLAGLRPNQGAFRGDLVGQARENSIYGELNTHPFSQNVDWNLGYAWAWVDGSKIPTNYKNQAFTSLGYTWHYGARQQVRLGYEFLYFGYGKNATNGFFDTTAAGVDDPVANLRPVTLANSNYVFGGYYSPKLFLMNAGRLDFRGSLFNKFLEYKMGGSLGAQTVRLGSGIQEDGNGTTLSKAFDANLILNFTDWLAAYGDVDYLDAGGQFNRWRFGGGLIVRPHIDALSPVFGTKPSKKMSKK
ncbi:tetratricopeptide repeat protein [Vampirovibrio sp.]|uniref:tetratricopeptide repeat protein n=1 Tax=Vampirovibrio sp. TaxID=2717857 RepID=UPI003594666F